MNFQRAACWFFTVIFCLDLVFLLFAFIRQLLAGEEMYGLSWLHAYAMFLVALPALLLFTLYYAFYVFGMSEEKKTSLDFHVRVNALLAFLIVLANGSYSFYIRELI